MYSVRLFVVESGFGFEIYRDGLLVIFQAFHPDVSGEEVMDEETATAQADLVIQRLKAADAIAATTPKG